jgi:hypothetical protein
VRQVLAQEFGPKGVTLLASERLGNVTGQLRHRRPPDQDDLSQSVPRPAVEAVAQVRRDVDDLAIRTPTAA